MNFFKTQRNHLFKQDDGLTELELQEQQIQAQIDALTQEIQAQPDRLREEQIKVRTTMPPPEGLEERRREHAFYAKISRGEAKNEKRYQTKSAIFLLSLFLATGALCFWIHQYLKQVL